MRPGLLPAGWELPAGGVWLEGHGRAASLLALRERYRAEIPHLRRAARRRRGDAGLQAELQSARHAVQVLPVMAAELWEAACQAGKVFP